MLQSVVASVPNRICCRTFAEMTREHVCARRLFHATNGPCVDGQTYIPGKLGVEPTY